MAKRRDPNSSHYINNKEFLEAMTAYRNIRIEAEESGDDRPQVPNYIGECFVKIANHLAYKANFVNYTNIIKQSSSLRKLISTAADISSLAKEADTFESESALSEAEDKLIKLRD